MRIGIVHTTKSPCCCGESVIKGLNALGYTYLLVDSEEIEVQSATLAEECDLVIDHTDTYRGRGIYRPLVRVLLEDCGAHVVGSSARACFVADNKAAAKARLAEAGIPVPPGIVIQNKTWELPRWLKPPLILKPAFQHMSRGIRIAHTIEEAYVAAAYLLELLRQPILVESYIPGRELAVSLLAGPEGLQVLPILEWDLGSAAADMLTEEFKLMDPVEGKPRVLKAYLPDEMRHELEALAQSAFRALGLRDYGRFDVRLSSNGNFFFLEANATPSLEPLEALATSALWAGFDYPELVNRMLSAAHNRYEPTLSVTPAILRIPLLTGAIEIERMEGVSLPPLSTIELASLLDIQAGEDVLELGCGSGLLSIVAAKLGAKCVVATDLDGKSLQAVQRNGRRNSVADQIFVCAGAWYEALNNTEFQKPRKKGFDVILATPPQTPGSRPFGPKYGGPDGSNHLFRIIEGARDFLKPESGRIWIMAISLANPTALWKFLRARFSEVSLVRQTERAFTANEYEALDPGLFDYLCSLRASGISDFIESKNGGYFFHNLFIRATGLR
jgi:D-alanine-D-alanine ligase-like ATP-grasp enzyme/SAM-dependent methyltransferase